MCFTCLVEVVTASFGIANDSAKRDERERKRVTGFLIGPTGGLLTFGWFAGLRRLHKLEIIFSLICGTETDCLIPLDQSQNLPIN